MTNRITIDLDQIEDQELRTTVETVSQLQQEAYHARKLAEVKAIRRVRKDAGITTAIAPMLSEGEGYGDQRMRVVPSQGRVEGDGSKGTIDITMVRAPKGTNENPVDPEAVKRPKNHVDPQPVRGDRDERIDVGGIPCTPQAVVMKCDPKTLEEGVRCLGDSLSTPPRHRHVRDVVKEREIKAVGITPDTELSPSLGSTDADITVIEARTAALFALVDEARRLTDDVLDPDRNEKIDALRERYLREHAALRDYVVALDIADNFLPPDHPLKKDQS